MKYLRSFEITTGVFTTTSQIFWEDHTYHTHTHTHTHTLSLSLSLIVTYLHLSSIDL